MMLLDEIPDLSVRLKNIARKYGLISLSDVAKYYSIHNTFTTLESCGLKTEQEFLNLLESNKKIICDETPLKGVFFNKQQLAQFKSISLYFSSRLSMRSSNLLPKILDEVTVNTVMNDLFKENILKDFKGCGAGSAKELTLFFKSVINRLMDDGFKKSHDDMIIMKFLSNSILQDSIALQSIKSIYNVKSLKDISLSDIVCFTSFYTLSKTHADIVRLDCKSELTQSDIATKVQLTRERVRQVLKGVYANQDPIALLIKSFIKSSSNTFNLNAYNKPYILKLSITNCKYDIFRESFIKGIIARVIDCSFQFLKNGLIDSLIFNESRFTSLMFRRLLTDIDIMHIPRRSVDKFIKFSDYVYSSVNDKIETYGTEVTIVKEILSSVYPSIVFNEEVIVIKRTIKKKVYELLFEILESEDTPMHIDEIAAKYNTLFVDRRKIAGSSIRSHLLRYPDLFINTTWSTYGLKKWEKERKMKGGTIKKLIIDYLANKKKPKHVYSITKHITKYRDTNIRSIYGNIQLDPHNNFIEFQAGFIGLTSKSYKLKDTNFNKVSNHWFKLLSNEYMAGTKSLDNIHDTVRKLAYALNVKKVQIESVLNDRIEKGELFLSESDYIHSVDVSKSDFKSIDIFNFPDILRELKANQKDLSKVALVSQCISLFDYHESISLSISDATILIKQIGSNE